MTVRQDLSLLVHLEFQDLGTSDWTLHNSAKGIRSVHDATIVGCQRAEGRCGRSRRWNSKASGLNRHLNSLFMSDGFDPGTIHWLIRNDGVLGLTVFGPGPGKFQILARPPVITLDQFGLWKHLAVVVDGPSGQVVHYVDGSPIAREALKLGLPFRLGAAKLGNWNAENGSKPEPALIRNLSGALDEFELFSRALSDAEVRELYNKGKPGR